LLTLFDGHGQDPGREDPAAAATSTQAEIWPESRCVACGAPSTTQPGDPVPLSVGDSRVDLPAELPPVELCDQHWSQLRNDWLLLGWCVDHYGEALRHCPQHERTIEPL
jgi:hypothetical protein